MKAILTYIFLPCLLMTPVAFDVMQTTGPHGGLVKKADNYHIELKTTDKFIYAYLLDNKKKTVDIKDISCSVRFFLPDSTDLIIQLKPFTEGGFSGENIEGYRYCKATFHFDPKTTITATFENQKLVVQKN